jgi:molybdopterin-binding protein
MTMRKVFAAAAMMMALGLAVLAFAAEREKMELKVGDEVYACACGAGCPCDTLSRKDGVCSCNKPMVKAKVTKVEEGKATLLVNSEARAFKTTGKFACACPPACECGTISQKAGKCPCGKEMKEVK